MTVGPSVRQRTITRRGSGIRERLRDLLTYRELLGNLIRKELKVKYKNSSLGFLWSLLNPLLYLVIFSVVFVSFLRVRLPYYPLYLLSGLLAWNLFATGLSSATGSIVANASLVGKVYFPREILPLSAIGAAFVHFVLQTGVLLVAMVVSGYVRFWDAGLALIPLALVIELVLLGGLALIASTVNVYLRDVEHLLELVLLAWFWLTPIVYPISIVTGWVFPIYLLNPMTPIVLAFQRALYAQVSVVESGDVIPVLVDAPLLWYLERLLYVGAGAVVVALVGWTLFRRLENRLAEEL